MDLRDFKDKLFEAAKSAGLEEFELYCKRENAFDVRVFEGEIDEYKNEKLFGVCFRGKINGKMGYASSEKIDEGVLSFLIDSVKQNAEIIEDTEEEFIYGGDPVYPEVVCYNPAINDIPTDVKIETAMNAEQAALDTDERIDNVPYCCFENGEMEIYITNSKGLDVQTKANYVLGLVTVLAEGEDEQVKENYEIQIGLDFNKLDPIALGQKAANRTLELLGASPVETGKYSIVFDPRASASLLETWISAFSAEQAHKGFSILAGKLGESIAADCVTIIDDPLMPGQTATTPFDSEGVASRTKTIVDKGIFKTFLHNTKTARKDGIPPTGNGFKHELQTPVDIAATNFYIKPGTESQEALLAKMDKGLLVTVLDGIESGANQTSGDFSVSVGGFLIEGGKPQRPVDQITVSGNFFTMIKDIVAVGNNLEFTQASDTNNAASPSIYVKSLDVAGE